MIPAGFEYVRARSLDEALEALADPDAKVLAGGHSLLPMMKLRLARPSLLVDIGALGFRGISQDGDVVSIGALTTYAELLTYHGTAIPDALRDAAAAVGDLQVRNMGTLGGAIAHGDPASDVAAAMIALDACLRLRSPTGMRECYAEEFFKGPFTTALEQQEILVHIAFGALASGEGSAYESIEDAGSGYPLAGAAVKVRFGDGQAECRVGLTGAGLAPCRAPGVEAALLDLDSQGVVGAVRDALARSDLVRVDGSIGYARQLAAVASARAWEKARTRAIGESVEG